jgi:hypothetical protein
MTIHKNPHFLGGVAAGILSLLLYGLIVHYAELDAWWQAHSWQIVPGACIGIWGSLYAARSILAK